MIPSSRPPRGPPPPPSSGRGRGRGTRGLAAGSRPVTAGQNPGKKAMAGVFTDGPADVGHRYAPPADEVRDDNVKKKASSSSSAMAKPSAKEQAKIDEASAFLASAESRRPPIFDEFFASCRIIDSSPGSFGFLASSNLSKATVKALDDWASKNRSRLDPELSEQMKDAVFWQFLFHPDMTLVQQMYRVFNLASHGRNYLEVLRHGVVFQRKDIKRGIILIVQLDLVKDIDDITFLAVPAVLLSLPDHLFEEYLMKDKRQAEAFVIWLDKFVGGEGASNMTMINQTQKHYAKLAPSLSGLSRLSSKSVEKFIKKCVEKFDLSFEKVAPRYTKTKTIGALRYEIKQGRDQKPLEIWRELIELKLRHQDGDVIRLFIRMLEREDFDEAVHWAAKLNVPHKDLSFCLAQKMEDIANGVCEAFDNNLEENWDEEDDSGNRMATGGTTTSLHNNSVDKEWNDNDWNSSSGGDAKDDDRMFKLPFAKDRILFVDSVKKYDEFIAYLKSNRSYLYGFDTEFTSYSATAKDSATLIQISSQDRVFLLDVVALLPVLTDADWTRLVESFFQNDTIRILGYGLGSDYSALETVHPSLRDLTKKSAANWLDLCQLVQRVAKGNLERLFPLPHEDAAHSLKGLTGLCKSLFNKELDKTYQVCDWSKRPLRPQQLEYAALDAFVCVAIYQQLENLAEEHNRQANFYKWCDALVKHKARLPKGFKFQAKKEEVKGGSDSKQPPPPGANVVKQQQQHRVEKVARPSKPYNESPINPPDLKVVCDSMLQGLCKKLRLLGVDAVALEQHEYFENCAVIAERDNRMILTRGGHAQKLQKAIKDRGHCYSVANDLPDLQIDEVFWYFNVVKDDKYIFSRCAKCNNDKYVTLSKYQAMTIRDNLTGNVTPSSSSARTPPTTVSNGDDGDDYIDDMDEEEEDLEVRVPLASLECSQYFFCDPFEVDKRTGEVRLGQGRDGSRSTTKILLQNVARKVVEENEKLYACVKCGKVYWEGSHWDRFLGKQTTNNRKK